jgi:sodium-dependent dicarboxylate transporter 2/3/5
LQRIDWGTLLLFGGGLSLGALASKTGLSFWLGQKLLAATGIESSLGLIALSAALALVLTEFMSNTAAVAIVLPVVSGMAGALGIPATPAVMAAALAASMAFVLPVSTPPNAIAYSTGLVTVGQMVRFGLALDALALAAICLWSWLVWVKL